MAPVISTPVTTRMGINLPLELRLKGVKSVRSYVQIYGTPPLPPERFELRIGGREGGLSDGLRSVGCNPNITCNEYMPEVVNIGIKERTLNQCHVHRCFY